MFLLCFVKLGATVVSYSSGNAGGIFAPSLYIGAMAGGAVGMIVHLVAPFPTANPGAYALAGMGTLFAGIIRAPMTSVFMIFEITQDYQFLVPLMVANMLSFAISRRLQPAPVYHALLEQDGVHLPAAPFGTASRRTAGHIMQGLPRFLDPDIAAGAALLTLQAEDRPAALVGNHDHLDGIVTRANSSRSRHRTPKARLCTRSLAAPRSPTFIPIALSKSWSSDWAAPMDCCRWSAAPMSGECWASSRSATS